MARWRVVRALAIICESLSLIARARSAGRICATEVTEATGVGGLVCASMTVSSQRVGFHDVKELGAYSAASLVDPTTLDASHASTSAGRYLTLWRMRRNFGPVPVTRSRSTVLTDSFNNSAASSWVSSGCISDRLPATRDHNSRQHTRAIIDGVISRSYANELRPCAQRPRSCEVCWRLPRMCFRVRGEVWPCNRGYPCLAETVCR